MISITNDFVKPPQETDSSHISLLPERVLRFLLLVVLGLVTISVIVTLINFLVPSFPMGKILYSKFSVSKEQSFPTLYSSLALALCSVLLFAIKKFKATTNARYTGHWRFLSFTFLYLAIDELLSIHEKASAPLHSVGVNGILHNAWLLPASVLVLVFGLSFLGFLFHLPKPVRRLVLLACTFIAGAGVIELLRRLLRLSPWPRRLGIRLGNDA